MDKDFALGAPGVFVVQDRIDDVAQPSWMTSRGWISGWNIKDLRLAYHSGSDTLYVGVNFFGIAGDSDGNGDPGTADPLMTMSGGIDEASLGGRKTISVGFALDKSGGLGTPVAIAGVPEIKTSGAAGLDAFLLANYLESNRNLGLNYGAALSASGLSAGLAFDPSAAHPGFEFSISGFRQIHPNLDPSTGFWIRVAAGSPSDVIAGEDSLFWTRVRITSIPEPNSAYLLVPSVLLLSAIGLKRRRARG